MNIQQRQMQDAVSCSTGGCFDGRDKWRDPQLQLATMAPTELVVMVPHPRFPCKRPRLHHLRNHRTNSSLMSASQSMRAPRDLRPLCGSCSSAMPKGVRAKPTYSSLHKTQQAQGTLPVCPFQVGCRNGRAGFNGLRVQGERLGLYGDDPSGRCAKICSTDAEALEEQQSTLRSVTSLAHFREKCTAALREAKAERDINTARLEETADCVLAERIESEYRGLFDRINKELRAEQKSAEDKAKNELKTLEKLNASDHEKLLDGLYQEGGKRLFVQGEQRQGDRQEDGQRQ